MSKGATGHLEAQSLFGRSKVQFHRRKFPGIYTFVSTKNVSASTTKDHLEPAAVLICKKLRNEHAFGKSKGTAAFDAKSKRT